MLSILEENYLQYSLIAGVDEAGRGPLAGPVACAAVIMPMDDIIDGVDDSKKLSPKKREQLYDIIIAKAISYSVVMIEPKIIDEINILQAVRFGMTRAIKGLSIKPEIVLIDGVNKLDIDEPYHSIIRGDSLSYNIAAASIIAKVTRDRLMQEYDKDYPLYNFSAHKGYGTKEHIDALMKFGCCPIHRKSFIKNFGSLPNDKA